MYNKIKADQLAARKSGNKLMAKLLTTLLGEIETDGKSKGGITDDIVDAKVKTFIDKNLEAQGLVKDEVAFETLTIEKRILDTYRETQMTTEEIEEAVKLGISEGKSNIGALMGYLSKKHKGVIDMGVANKVARGLL